MQQLDSAVVYASAPARLPEARLLADRLGLRLVDALDARGSGVAVVVAEERVQLQQLGAHAPGPVFADFAGAAASHRRRFGQQSASPFARAVGLGRGRPPPAVVDATAGLGRDAFVLASLGCSVLAIERSPVLFALLEDAAARGEEDREVRGILRERLQLRHGDARDVLRAMQAAGSAPAVVTVDPMFPARRKQAALVKKEMRVCRLVAGDDPDAAELLEIARAVATSRVVVKRHRLAPTLAEAPSTVFEGRSTRFDVYLAV